MQDSKLFACRDLEFGSQVAFQQQCLFAGFEEVAAVDPKAGELKSMQEVKCIPFYQPLTANHFGFQLKHSWFLAGEQKPIEAPSGTTFEPSALTAGLGGSVRIIRGWSKRNAFVDQAGRA